MTPLIYPDHIRPIAPYNEPVKAQCPNTGEDVIVSPCFKNGAEMYCDKCKKIHTVLRTAKGVELI